MAHASLNCLQLRDLNISFCHKLSDAGIRSVVTSCSLLTSLDVSHCLCISDETLREIAQTCLNLHVLNASYCPNISLEVCLCNSFHRLVDLHSIFFFGLSNVMFVFAVGSPLHYPC